MGESCAVVDDLMRRMEECNGFIIEFPVTGDKISVSKWGQSRKSYILSLCNGNDNVYEGIGIVKENQIDKLKEFLKRNVNTTGEN